MLKNVFITFFFIAVLLVVFGSGMSKQISRDEHMYCTGGVLTAESMLPYRDFSYVAQMPLHPLLLAGVYKITGTTYYLLAARLVSIILQFGICLLLFLTCRMMLVNLKARDILAAAGVILYVFNPFVDYASGRAWNHDCVIFLVMMALYTYLKTPANLWLYAMMGLFVSAAVFTRSTTALVWFVFVAALLIEQPRLLNRSRKVCAYLIGSIVAAAWPAYVIFSAPEAAWINLLVIPTLNGQFLHELGLYFGKTQMLLEVLQYPAYLLLIVAVLAAVGYICIRVRDRINSQFWILTAIAVAFFVIAFIPPTIWQQYFAPPVAFVIIFLAYASDMIFSESSSKTPLYLICIVMLAIMVLGNDAPIRTLPQAFNFAAWEPVKFHQAAETITSQAGKDKRALTLAPLYALESGNKIYTELSAGSFAYRVADRLTPDQRKIAHVIGPSRLADVAREKPPQIIILSGELEFLEKPLSDLAGPDFESISIQATPPVTVFYR